MYLLYSAEEPVYAPIMPLHHQSYQNNTPALGRVQENYKKWIQGEKNKRDCAVGA
jgi:hypothetical protein